MQLPGAILSPILKKKKKEFNLKKFIIFSQKKKAFLIFRQNHSYILGNGTSKPNLNK